jgi:polysaccharide pyruvyl transferase WcaK-like protein
MPALTFPKNKCYNLFSLRRFIKYYVYYFIKLILLKLKIREDHYIKGTKYYYTSYESYIKKIACLKYIIVGRYHSLCFTLKTFTPFYSLKSNSHKIESMLKDIGINNRVIQISDLKTINMIPFDETEILKIQNYIKNAEKQIHFMFKQIRNLLEERDF